MVSGIFFVEDGVSFPAIRIKILSGTRVLVNVFTDKGILQREANQLVSGIAKDTFIAD